MAKLFKIIYGAIIGIATVGVGITSANAFGCSETHGTAGKCIVENGEPFCSPTSTEGDFCNIPLC
jgi:hypothetical protein